MVVYLQSSSRIQANLPSPVVVRVQIIIFVVLEIKIARDNLVLKGLLDFQLVL